MQHTTRLKKRIEQEVEKQAKKRPRLTARERQILELMAGGRSYREAAQSAGMPKDKLAREQKKLADKLDFPRWSEVLRQAIPAKAVTKVLKDGLKAVKPVSVRIIGRNEREVLTVPDQDTRTKCADLLMKYSQDHEATRPVTINLVQPGAAKTNILIVPQGQVPALLAPELEEKSKG